MPVQTVHSLYTQRETEWALMRASKEGERAIKAAKSVYLPMPSGFAEAQEKALNDGVVGPYDRYVTRSEYPDWINEALRTMLGIAFTTPAKAELPATMRRLEQTAGVLGEPLETIARRAVAEVLLTGRYGLLAEVSAAGNPYIACYVAESITNWRVSQVGADGLSELELAVLMESYEKDTTDIFAPKSDTQYRVLRMDEGGYVVEIWRKPATGGEYVITETLTPTLARGGSRVPYSAIPLTIAGSTGLAPEPDEIPLIGMARAALKYYQLSADYYLSLFMTANPTPVVTGITKSEANEAGTNRIGSTTVWHLPSEQAKAYYLEVSGAGIGAMSTAMQYSHQRALEAGTKLMELDSAESGVAKRARQRDQQATLQSVVANVSAAIQETLRYHAFIMGENPDSIVYELPLDFSQVDVDAQLITALNTAVTNRTTPNSILWDYYRKAGMVTGTDEEIQQDILDDDAASLDGGDGDGDGDDGRGAAFSGAGQ